MSARMQSLAEALRAQVQGAALIRLSFEERSCMFLLHRIDLIRPFKSEQMKAWRMDQRLNNVMLATVTGLPATQFCV